MDSGSLHCPSCGAAVSSDATQCKYCNSLLQTVACPACFGLMFVGSKFCPHCGTAAVIATTGQQTPHCCPRCETEQLKVITVANVRFEECAHCGGLWVGVPVFNQICAQREVAEAAIAVPLPPPVPVENHVRYLKCPQCSNLMNRYSFADRCGVVLDKCKAHGIWFDRDELRQIIEFIRAGGLAAAREHEIEKLKRQQEMTEIDHRLANVGTGGRGYGSFGDAYNSEDGFSLLRGLAGLIHSFLE